MNIPSHRWKHGSHLPSWDLCFHLDATILDACRFSRAQPGTLYRVDNLTGRRIADCRTSLRIRGEVESLICTNRTGVRRKVRCRGVGDALCDIERAVGDVVYVAVFDGSFANVVGGEGGCDVQIPILDVGVIL